VLYFSFLCEFFHDGFSHKVFNEATCAIPLTKAMYCFLQEHFFPTGFLNGVFNEVCAYRSNHPMRSIVKHTDSILEEKKKKES